MVVTKFPTSIRRRITSCIRSRTRCLSSTGMRVTDPFWILGISSWRGANKSSSLKAWDSIKCAMTGVLAVFSGPGISKVSAVSHKNGNKVKELVGKSAQDHPQRLETSIDSRLNQWSNFPILSISQQTGHKCRPFSFKVLSRCRIKATFHRENYSLHFGKENQSYINDPDSSIWDLQISQSPLRQTFRGQGEIHEIQSPVVWRAPQ